MTYQYDSWGNIINTTDTSRVNLANINPLRYRSYYYDSETNLYYLNSRYYNPAIGRFITADGQLNSGVIGNNMYIYCNNNPVMNVDPDGCGPHWIKTLFEVTAIVAIAVVVVAAVVVAAPVLAVAGGVELGLVAGTAATAASVGEAASIVALASSVGYVATNVIDNVQDNTMAQTKTKTDDRNKEIVFPENPYEFNPKGLIPVYRDGSYNGPIIQWNDPLTGQTIFEWDANTKHPNGPHYHMIVPGTKDDRVILPDGKNGHYYAGDVIPSPYDIYFR